MCALGLCAAARLKKKLYTYARNTNLCECQDMIVVLFLVQLCYAYAGANSGEGEGDHTTRNEQGSWFDKAPLLPLEQVAMYVAAVQPSNTCQHCGVVFGRSVALRNHMRACYPSVAPPPVVRHTRRRYTFRQKRKLLLQLDQLRNTVPFALTVMSNTNNIAVTSLQEWDKHRELIFRMAAAPVMGGKLALCVQGPDYPEQEYALYLRFVWRRQYQQLRVTSKWLRLTMASLLIGVAPPGTGYSKGWASRFCQRWSITSQCRTNNHRQSVSERLPAIREFHQWLIHGLQRSEPQRCMKFGRFPPHRMFHMDQVPLSFVPTTHKTLNAKGSRCVVADPCNSDNKRFCTLQVTICADPGANPVKLELIFRGTGKRLSDREQAAIDALTNIIVRWQKKAWADEGIMIDYLVTFREATMSRGEVLLGMDNHGAQRTVACELFMEYFQIVCAFTPANCTDCCSPVDHHVGKLLKEIINGMYEADYAKNRLRWNTPSKHGGLSISDKRILMMQWASAAWTKMHTDHQECLRMAFVRTGFLVAMDGSEDHEIELWKGGKGQYKITPK